MNQTLLETISRIAKTSQDRLLPSTTLSSLGLNNSIGLELVRSALERKLSLKLAPLKWSDTLSEIEARLEGRESTPPKTKSAPSLTAPAPSPSIPGPFSIGLDIEEVKNLPEANYREDAFYSTRFSEREIATAMLRPNPREHLCGTFCAKEALRKANPQLFGLAMSDIEISHDQGRPLASLKDATLQARFQFQVSISHTDHYAAAVVLAFCTVTETKTGHV